MIRDEKPAGDLKPFDAVIYEDEDGNEVLTRMLRLVPVVGHFQDEADRVIGWDLVLASGSALMLEGPNELVWVPARSVV